jgi:serine/threonine protein kinase
MDGERSSVEQVKGAHHFALTPGTKLLEFEIEEVLGHGGFGITYRALDTTLRETVAIKEYFPNALAGRVSSITVSAKSETDREDFAGGLKAFLEEARLITRFRHPNIVHVRRFFEMHGTGYIVLDYERGQTLSKRLGGAPIPEAELRGILAGLLDGLEAMHERAILHRDLKPSNVIIREDGTPVLIDFGAARDFAGRNSRSITAIAAPGYSPPEQYGVGEQQQGPWTDLYSLGAIAYRCVTGTVPVDSLRRLRKDPLVPAATAAAGKYDAALLRTIDWMLRLEERERPASVQEIRAALARSAPSASQRMRRPLIWSATAAAVIGLIVIAVATTSSGRLSAVTCDKLGLFCADQIKTAAATDTIAKAEPIPPPTSVASANAVPSAPTTSVPDVPSGPHSALTADTAAAPQTAAKQLQSSIPLSDAAEAWAVTKDTSSVAVLETYAARYKGTFFAELARVRIEELKRQQIPAPTPSTSATIATPTPLEMPSAPASAAASSASSTLGPIVAATPPVQQVDASVPISDPILLNEFRDRLYELNFDPEPLDSSVTDATRKAIKEFEQQINLPPTGIATMALLGRLRDLGGLKPWGSIVYGKDSGRWSMAWNENTRKAAVARARVSCGDSKACPIEISFFGTGCGVFAYSESGWAITERDDISKAKAAALADCSKGGRSCQIVASVCADGTNRFITK